MTGMNSNIRRFVAIAALVVISSVAAAQNITLAVGEKSHKKGYIPTLLLVDKADAEGHYYSVEPSLTATRKVKCIQVREVDMNYKGLRSVSVNDSKGCRVVHARREGGRMNLLLCSDESKRYALRRVSVDLASFTVVEDQTLADRSLGKKQYVLDWSGASPSGDHFALVYAILEDGAGRAEVQGMLCDGSLKPLWTQPLSLAAISQVQATDDERLATVGFSNGKGESDGAIMEFSITASIGTQVGYARSDSKLGGMALLGVFGNKVLATALETDGTASEGCSAFLFDVARNVMANESRHRFSDEEGRILSNGNLTSKLFLSGVDLLTLRGKTSTADGGAALYGRTWSKKVSNAQTGMWSSYYYYNGMILVRADSLGNITWTRPIVHDNTTNGDLYESRETDIVACGNDILLVTNESANSPDVYDPSASMSPPFMRSYLAIAAYRFNPKGDVAKTKLTPTDAGVISTSLRPQPNGFYTFVASHTFGHIAEISVK